MAYVCFVVKGGICVCVCGVGEYAYVEGEEVCLYIEGVHVCV